jgi:hypothetical protein
MSTLPALYELAHQYRDLEDMARLDDLPPDVVKDTLDALTGDIETKGVNIVKFAKNQEVIADAIDEAAAQMKLRAASIRRKADSLRAYLQFHMQATGITRIECPYFVISLRNNPESVKIADGVTLPAEYMKQAPPPPPVPDKAKLKADLKAGKTIDGAWLEAGQRLEVKT